MRRAALVVIVLAATPAVAWAVGLQTKLVGEVGPGFTIGLKKDDGTRVLNLEPGPYQLEVSDQGDIHNFHLTGPGVDVKTSIEETGLSSFDVTLADGAYRFFCDFHPDQMRGSFTVGVVAPPTTPPPPSPSVGRLRATVGPGAAIAMRKGLAKVKTVKAGRYLITVDDRSARDNFHLTGPGVNRKTSVTGKRRSTWTVTLRRGGVYRFRSDAHPVLRGSFRAT